MVRNLAILRFPLPFPQEIVLAESVGTLTFAGLCDTPVELIVQSTRYDFALPDPGRRSSNCLGYLQTPGQVPNPNHSVHPVFHHLSATSIYTFSQGTVWDPLEAI